MKMIELTREEAIDLLKAIARFEGFLMGLRASDCSDICAELEYPVKLLSEKLRRGDEFSIENTAGLAGINDCQT
jgi:hypothetical protein